MFFFEGGKVLTWGRGTSGQLGHSEMVNSPHPKLVMSLDTYFITHASAGWNHSGFVSGMFRKLILDSCWRMLIESIMWLCSKFSVVDYYCPVLYPVVV